MSCILQLHRPVLPMSDNSVLMTEEPLHTGAFSLPHLWSSTAWTPVLPSWAVSQLSLLSAWALICAVFLGEG